MKARRNNKTWTPWSPEMDARLLELYPAQAPREIAAVLGVTTRAVSCRLWKLRDKGEIKTSRRYKYWKLSEIEYIRQNHGKVTLEELGRRLGRTNGAVEDKARRLEGVARKQPWSRWTAERVKYLRERYGTTPTDIIAQHLGISERAVATAASRFGVKKAMRRSNAKVKAVREALAVMDIPIPEPKAKPKPKPKTQPKTKTRERVRTWDDTNNDKHRLRWQRAKEIECLLEQDASSPDAIALVDEYNALARQLTGFSVPERYRL